jgi:D-mannonate dehydratase
MEKQLKDLTDIEIKALCYDLLAQQQNIQQNLTILNQELAKRAQQSQRTPQSATQSYQPYTTESYNTQSHAETALPTLGSVETEPSHSTYQTHSVGLGTS